jgi:2-polyprenyl-3-methyl-5-hydroxy-6-metoxy-1,4-benzoquinol methylase
MLFGRGSSARKLESIPVGHYHDVMLTGHPVRRAWHQLKFTRVLELLPQAPGQSILDIGCFAGTFLSLVDESRFTRQVGVDILPEQVAYAQAHFGSAHRQFVHVSDVSEISSAIEGTFDCITLIEVIEHLSPAEIDATLQQAARKLRPGGRLVMSTPNYASAWPLLEVALNQLSDVTYDEQHITRFTWFDCERKLAEISPALGEAFELELKTTTHLVSPFLAVLGVDFASRVSSAVTHKGWKMPFGNLVMLSWLKR